MKDYNFFIAYNKKEEWRRKQVILLVSVVSVVSFAAFCVLSISAVFEFRMQSIRFEIDSNRMFLEHPSTVEDLSKQAVLNEWLNSIKTYNEKAKLLSDAVTKSSIIKSGLMTTIAENIPLELTVNSMSVSGDLIRLTCESSDRRQIAEFQRRLSELSYIGGVYISNISGSDNDASFSFIMSITVKDVPDYVWAE